MKKTFKMKTQTLLGKVRYQQDFFSLKI